MSKSVHHWLTVKVPGTPGLLAVSSVGCHLWSRAVHRAAENHTGEKWRTLYRRGWRVVHIIVREVGPA